MGREGLRVFGSLLFRLKPPQWPSETSRRPTPWQLQMADPDTCSSIGTSSIGDEHTKMMELPLSLDIPRIKCLHCDLCGATPDHESPFEDSTEDDQWGGYIPWNRYRKAKGPEGGDVKVPLGRLCKACRATFIKTGLGLKYGTVNKYLEKQGEPEQHHKFMRARKRLVELANQSELPAAVLKKELSAAMTKVKETQCKGSRRIQKRTFVEEPVFQQLYADNKELSKLFGDKCTDLELGKEGRWVRGHIGNGLPGHHEVEDYQQIEVAKSSVHEDGSSPIDADQANRKFDALVKLSTASKSSAEEKLSSVSE